MVQHEPIRKRSITTQEIPDKLYFRIGEVAKLCEVPAYVLRFWEGEFPQLKPNKGGTGQRLYRRKDVETALRVKSLLYDEGYTIPGARTALKAELRGQRTAQGSTGEETEAGTQTVAAPELRKLQKELRDLLRMLSNPAVKSGVLSIRGGRPEAETPAATTRRAEIRAFPKVRQPSLYDSFDRLFDTLPE